MLNFVEYRNGYATFDKSVTNYVELPPMSRDGYQDVPHKKAMIKITMARTPDFFKKAELFEKCREETQRQAAEKGMEIQTKHSYGFKKNDNAQDQSAEKTSATSSAQKPDIAVEPAC